MAPSKLRCKPLQVALTQVTPIGVRFAQGNLPDGARKTLWKALDGNAASATCIQAAMSAWYACAVPSLSTASGSHADDSRMPVTAMHKTAWRPRTCLQNMLHHVA
jgi:hypothetical protein